MSDNDIKFIELFAGIGGFRYGLERANDASTGQFQSQCRGRSGNQEEKIIENSSGTPSKRRRNPKKLCGGMEGMQSKNPNLHKPTATIGDTRGQCEQFNNRGNERLFTCIWANEWDQYACRIYRKNFGEKELHEGDIETVDPRDIPDHDILTGGFPCQSFSIAGKRKGFKDPRGNHFFNIARILDTKKPRMCILENVKGLLSHDNGDTFRTILWILHELGYDVQWQVHNSKNWVPQNRERVFIIGHIRGERRPEVFPFRETGGTYSESNRQIVHAIDSNYHKGWLDHGQRTIIEEKSRNLIYEGAIMSEKNKQWLEDGKELSRNFPQGQRVYGKNGIASTIAGNAGGLGGKTGLYKIEEKKIRRLTPIECERLQGFPDNWTEGISDTQRYKCLGNAVTTNVITEIGKRLIEQNI